MKNKIQGMSRHEDALVTKRCVSGHLVVDSSDDGDGSAYLCLQCAEKFTEIEAMRLSHFNDMNDPEYEITFNS